MWVVQEFILAKEVELVAANDVVPTTLFYDAMRALQILFGVLFRSRSHIQPSLIQTQAQLHTLVTRMCQLIAFRERYLRSKCSDDPSAQGKLGIPLGSCVLYLARGRACWDERDRIYAMRALSDDDLGVRPDYVSSSNSIMLDFIKRCLLSGDLSVLHAGGIHSTHNPQLPSFAPGFGEQNEITLPLCAQELGFRTATDHSVTYKCSTGNTISLKGIRVDFISRSACIDLRPRLQGTGGSEAKFRNWLQDKQDKPRARTIKATYGKSVSEELYGRIVALEKTLEAVSGSHQYWLNLREWYPLEIEALTSPYLENRELFETHRGYIGLGPKWMAPGDQVVIFDGAQTPFVLRKAASDDTTTSDRWQIVGDCFLLGWMQGDYFGHTVVDERPRKRNNAHGTPIRKLKKVLVREYFVLC